MAKKATKKSIGANLKKLAKSFGALTVSVQRVALLEMNKVYEKASSSRPAKKAKKSVKKAVKKAKKRAKR